MEKIKLALSGSVVEPYLSMIHEICDVRTVGMSLSGGIKPDEDTFIAQCDGCEIIYIDQEPVTKKCIDTWKAHGLKLLGCGRGTPVNVDWKAAAEAGIPLVYTPGRNANSVSEYFFGLLLSLCRRISANNHALRNGQYLGPEKEDVLQLDQQTDVTWYMPDGSSPMFIYGGGMELYERTLSIFGFGAIGKRIANTARNGFGMQVLVYDPFVEEAVIEAAGCQKVSLEEALSRAEIVSINLPVNKHTIGIVDESWFSQMKPGTIFINTARAAVVDQKAMIDAIVSGRIAGAAMDVMWQEPAPANHPLLDRDNVLITSHLAGMSCDIPKWQSVMVYDEIRRYVAGEPQKLVWTRLE